MDKYTSTVSLPYVKVIKNYKTLDSSYRFCLKKSNIETLLSRLVDDSILLFLFEVAIIKH